ncbi:MAG: hypothetical protein A2Y62_03830 [Candidatus Fischerbacteria bacterium RBG_13_37_8]|uniref:DUF2127 domain-containing protein n=1 Tax=Candidatus Fischerbacteria bacterium RBG_13_37_8 TaxID=1817863 RepID=A0A1F5V5D9_9BACT|nr:MAG: hypothetical protein A2Y62_03830 [Candidatus Fischerbacteria bacterium RBG_13_37_8]
MEYQEGASNQQPPSPEEKQIEEKLKNEQQFKSGAGWFFWIAGLSLINSIIMLAGKNWAFIVGLGITQIIDSVALHLGEAFFYKLIAFVFDLIAAGIFIVFGVFARKGHRWSFIIGMILYALDGLLFILVADYLSIGFHALVLFFLYSGLSALKKIKLRRE